MQDRRDARDAKVAVYGVADAPTERSRAAADRATRAQGLGARFIGRVVVGGGLGDAVGRSLARAADRLVGQGLRSGIGRGFRVGVGGAHRVAEATGGDHAAGAEDVAEYLMRELRR